MIGKLTGQINHISGQTAIVNVGGVGYMVFLTTPAMAELAVEQSISIWIKTVVRSEALELYGFLNQEELQYFTLLINISGIGPKSALAILSLAPPATLRQAIISGDSDYLTKVSGIGKKTARKIILELKDKLAGEAELDQTLTVETETLEALKALGYSTKQARVALRQIPDEAQTTEDKIRAALKVLG